MTKQELRKLAIILATAHDLIKLLEERTTSDFTKGRARASRHNIALSIDLITNSVRGAARRERIRRGPSRRASSELR